ncbi:MAG TPA: pentapeptide repeat-containing protein, partial [Methylophilus sp.]
MRYLQHLAGIAALLLSTLTYAGELGNQCATSLANGSAITTKCEINTLYMDKTYCFGSEAAKAAFLLDPAATVAKAAAFYATLTTPERVKITQADALRQIQSKQCDLSNQDAGYLI